MRKSLEFNNLKNSFKRDILLLLYFTLVAENDHRHFEKILSSRESIPVDETSHSVEVEILIRHRMITQRMILQRMPAIRQRLLRRQVSRATKKVELAVARVESRVVVEVARRQRRAP